MTARARANSGKCRSVSDSLSFFSSFLLLLLFCLLVTDGQTCGRRCRFASLWLNLFFHYTDRCINFVETSSSSSSPSPSKNGKQQQQQQQQQQQKRSPPTQTPPRASSLPPSRFLIWFSYSVQNCYNMVFVCCSVFLVATKRLYKRQSPSVSLSVCLSVRRVGEMVIFRPTRIDICRVYGNDFIAVWFIHPSENT